MQSCTRVHAYIIVDIIERYSKPGPFHAAQTILYVLCKIIPFDRHMHLVSHFFALLTLLITVQDRTLLIAGFGTKLKLPMCNVCHMPCCFRTQQDYTL